MNSPGHAAPTQGVRHGASTEDWRHFADVLGLESDLLSVIVNPDAKPSPRSAVGDFAKTPSRYDAQRRAVGIARWPDHVATAQDIRRWASEPDYGACVIGRTAKAIDIDVDDPETSAAIRQFIELGAGVLPCRRRTNSGKCLLAFRMPGDAAKRSFRVKGGGLVEFLGHRQQFLLAGRHRTGARYEWDGGLPAALPELTPVEFEGVWEALVAEFAEPGSDSRERGTAGLLKPRRAADAMGADVAYIYEHWEVLGEETDGRVHVRCPNEDQHTSDSGTSSTSYFPAGVGRAEPGFSCLHAHCSHLTASLFLQLIGFDDPAQDFEPVALGAVEAAEAAAAAIKNAKKPASVRLETQRDRAKRIGREGEHGTPTQRVMTGSEMLEELMFIAEGARVSFVREPRFVLPFEEFKRFTSGSVETAKNAAGRVTKVHRAAMWIESPDRKTVRTQTFAPGRPAVCQSPDDVLAQNLWVPRTAAAPANWAELVTPFFEHVAYLVPDAGERARFLDWLAHIEQDPGTLPSTHYLLVAKQTGIGRNWLAYALARVFAGHTALGFDLGEALRTGFNGMLSQRLLAVVDELHEGGPGGTNKPAAEKLKSMLTETTRRVNPKYGRQHVEFNCCRFLMFSNHEAALPLADNDRRVVVLENPSTRQSADYYARLYALLDEPGLGPALAEAFRRRDISRFNPGEVAPHNAAKARTIRAGRSEVEQAVRDVAAEWPSACITSARLSMEVTEALGGKSWNTQSVCVAAGLVKYPGRVKVDGVAAHIWVLRDQRAWCSASPAAVAAEVRRGVQLAEFYELA